MDVNWMIAPFFKWLTELSVYVLYVCVEERFCLYCSLHQYISAATSSGAHNH